MKCKSITVFSQLLAWAVVGLAACPAWAGPAAVLPVRVLTESPHDRGAFTQGFFCHQGLLYETSGGYGKSFLTETDLISGRELRRLALPPEVFAEGAAWVDGRIYVLTWQERTALVIDPASFTITKTLPYSGEGWGLTFDGQNLWRSDGSSYLWRHQPGTMAELGRVEVLDGEQPVKDLNELEWDPAGGLILANVWHRSKVAAIDPATGNVAFWLEASALVNREKASPPPSFPDEAVLNGLALTESGQGLWLTGKLWSKRYLISWPPKR